MPKRVWVIEITETDEGMSAVICRTDKVATPLSVSVTYADYPNRDEAIGDLFAGPLPNLRDSFDTI